MPRINNNQAGVNGYGIKQYPPDEVLGPALHQYAKECLTVEEKLARLNAEHGLCIKKSKLAKLNTKFNVPSVRKPPPRDVAQQAIMAKVAEDVNQTNGTGSLKSMLANEGIQLSRSTIRSVLAQNAPDGLAKRFPGARKLPRRALEAIGPNQQWHADGHEKLGAQALNMGGVGIGIYAYRDQWTGFGLHLTVAPNVRLATTAGHIQLDCIEKHGYIPLTQVTDKGSETSYIYAHQVSLHSELAPDVDATKYPPYLYLRSVHNTPIESFWTWFTKNRGLNLKTLIRQGLTKNYYNPSNDSHKKLFNWLWPKIVQNELDEFTEYWNNHRVRYQADKKNISGTTPRNAWTIPESFGGRQCGISVHKTIIDGLRAAIPVSREEAFRWIDDETAILMDEIYTNLGSPHLRASAGWVIFNEMATRLM